METMWRLPMSLCAGQQELYKTMIRRRNEIPLYEKKIKELHEEVERLAHSLSELETKKSNLNIEISFLEKRKKPGGGRQKGTQPS